MATRFYMPRWDGRAADVSPSFGSQWERTTNAFRRLAPTTKGASTPLSTTGGDFTKDAATAGYDVLQMQLVSDPLAAQTISGTFSAVVRGGESVNTADASLQIVLRVVSNDGSTERGVLYAGHAAALNATVGAVGQEFGTTSMTRIFPAGTALSSVAAQAGDRLVIEVGQRFHGTNTGVNGFLTFGDNSATADHTLAAGTATALCPWLELSADLTFQGSTVAGAFSAGLPALSAASAGSVRVSGAAGVGLPPLGAALAGAVRVSGATTATIPALSADVAAAARAGAVLAATLPGLGSAASGALRVSAAMTVGLPALSVAFVGAVEGGGTVERPFTGVTARTAAGVTGRPLAGVMSRPAAGVVARPGAGVVVRP